MARIESLLEPGARETTGRALQQTLVDLVDLSLTAKQAHWTVTGPRFRALHLQLDEVVATARAHTDTVAERCAAIGVPPDGRAGTVAAASAVPQPQPGWETDDGVVAHFVDAHAKVIAGLRERINEVADPDPVTQDLLIAVAADLEKQYWMFQAEQG
jgi:starvation-inducible DNA-binding protein